MAFQYNECEFQETLEAGNMIACIKYMKKLHKVENVESIVCTSLFASTIGNMIQRFVKGTHIPVEYAEAILEYVEKLLIGPNNNDPKMLENLAGNDAFITSNFKIIADYRTQIFKESPNYHELCSYSSHRCYETVLFLLVALVESSKILVVFIKALKIKRILELVSHLGHVILFDKSYVTQELALDVICRIYHFYSKINIKVLPDILKLLPPPISKACSDVNVGTSSILRNMRPLLTEINKSNQNIHSLSLKSFYIQKELSSGTEGDRFVVVDKWLDVEFERFSFSVMDDDSISYSLVKTSYHTIKQLYFDSRTLTMKVFLGFCSENLAKILTTDEKRSPEGFSPYLCFTFHDEQAISTAKRLLEHQMSLREVVSHQPPYSTDRAKMSVVSTRSASMCDAEMIAKTIGTKVGAAEESLHQPLFGSELLGDRGGEIDEETQQPEQQLQHPIQEVVAQDPSIAATTSAPQDSPSSISSPEMNFGSAEDAIAPEATRSDQQTKTARQRRGRPNKSNRDTNQITAVAKPVGAKSVPVSLSYSLSHSRKGTATRSIRKKGDNFIDEKENLPLDELDDFSKPAELNAMVFTPKKRTGTALSTVRSASSNVIEPAAMPVDKENPTQKRGLSILAATATPAARKEKEAVLPMPAPVTTTFQRPGTATAAKKKMLAAAAAAAAVTAAAAVKATEKVRLSEDEVRLTQDSTLTASKKPLARMRFTPSKPSDTAAGRPSGGFPLPPPVSLSPPMSPSNASVHTNNTNSSKRKYGKMAASITNATAKLQSNQDTAKLFNFDGPGNKLHSKRQKPSSSSSSNSIPDKSKGKTQTLPGRNEKGVYRTPTTANLQKHNAFVSTTNLVFQPIQGLQYESDSERLSQKKRKLSQSPKKAKQQLIQVQVREPSPPADYEQLTQPQGPEPDIQGDDLYHFSSHDHEREEEAQGYEEVPIPAAPPIKVPKEIQAPTPVMQKPESHHSKSPEPLPSPKPPAAATAKAAHTQRPVTAIAKPEKKQLLKKLLGKEPAAVSAAAVPPPVPSAKEATAPGSGSGSGSAEKSKYFSDPFAGSRQSVRPLKLQAASSSSSSAAVVAASASAKANEVPIPQPQLAPLTQAPKTRSTKRSAEIPSHPLEPPTAAISDQNDTEADRGMDSNDFEPLPAAAVHTIATSVVAHIAEPLFTPPAKYNQTQQSKLITSGLTTAATASTSLLTSASAQSISQDIATISQTPAAAPTSIWRCHLQPKQLNQCVDADSAAQTFFDAPPKGSSMAPSVALSKPNTSAMFSLSLPDGAGLHEGAGAGNRGGKNKGREEKIISQEKVSDADYNALANRRRSHASDDDDDEEEEQHQQQNSDVDSDADSDHSYSKGPPARSTKGAAKKGRKLNSHRSHGRTSTNKGKKSAAVEEEDEEVDEFESTQRSSDDDQEIVLQMLIQELLKFKEEREQRRRESAVRRVVSHASAAMEAFLRQAAECADSSCAETKAQAMAKLQTLSTSAEEIFNAIVNNCEHLSTKGASIRERQEKLAAETTALIAEASAAWAQCRSEETQLRSDLLEKKRLARGAVSKLRGHSVLAKATRPGTEAGTGTGTGASKRKKPTHKVRQQQQEEDEDENENEGDGSTRSKRQKYQLELLEAMHQI